MTDDNWMDAAGNSPEENETGWSWDDESLRLGQYVGYKLYLVLRDRLTTLEVPTVAHNTIITEMIDLHDETLLTRGQGMATLVMLCEPEAPSIPMAILDQSEYSVRLDGS